MRAPGIRYTIATGEDVENLGSKWSFENGELTVKNISGFIETSIVQALPTRLQGLTNGTDLIRITKLASTSQAELFFSDHLPGFTIEVQQKTPKVPRSGSHIVELIRLRLGIHLRSDGELSDFVDVRGTQVKYMSGAMTYHFEQFLLDTYPLMTGLWIRQNLLEYTIDYAESKVQLRTVSELPAELSLAKLENLKTEVGIVQRQRRHLQDAEYKGLSAFLPGSDMSPFMIFFDKRLESHVVKPHGSYRSSIEGTGSHLSFNTIWISSAHRKSTLKCSLHAEYRLPEGYFFDVYELEELFPGRFHIFGEQDLEKPVWQVKPSFSILYLELESGLDASTISVPFHARYFHPVFGGKNFGVEVEAPRVFAACPRPDPAFSDNPWDSFTVKQRVLGEENSFEFLQYNGTYRLSTSAATADAAAEHGTVIVTLLAIVLGFLYVLFKILTAPSRRAPMLDSQLQMKQGKTE